MVIVRAASVEEFWAVKQQVLRPDGPLLGDQPPQPGWLHVVAETQGRVVGGCSIGPAPWIHPEIADLPPPTWQLRSMAVLPDYRGGVGARLLHAVVAAAVRGGAGSCWANAREAAVTLYVRGGWQVVGDPWVKPGVGPHRFVVLSSVPR